MKKILPILMILALTLGSCKQAPVEWVDGGDFSALDPKKSFIPYNSVENTVNEQTVSACPLPSEGENVDTRTTSVGALTVIKQLFGTMFSGKVRSYCGTYWSVDEKGEPVKLSGRIILPSNGKVSRIMVASHFTIGRYDEAPTMSLPLECLFAIDGLAVICPDYLGYGVTSHRIHPYLCTELTARNVVDMYFAALPFLEHIGSAPQYPDIFLLGYSQGGAATLAVQQYFEENHPNDVQIRLNMAGSGPYDVATTYDVLIEQDYTDFPCAIPMLIQGLNVGDNLGLDYKEFFKPFLLENYEEWINSKQYTMGQITQFIGTKKISEVLTEKARNKANDGTITLYKSMINNSICNSFIPISPVYLFHSFDDNVVPYENSAALMEVLNYYQLSNVKTNFGHYGGHTNGFVRFLFTTVSMLKDNGDL